MITVITYLRSLDGENIPHQDANTPPPDPSYIEGAIQVCVGRFELIPPDWSDYIDQLWAYFADALNDVRSTGHAELYFPDQPVHVSFTRNPKGRLQISVAAGKDRRTVEVEAIDLQLAMRTSGIDFMEHISQLVPENAHTYTDILNRLREG